ncbi:ATPase SWSAP1-like [Zootermopsis nevadensis]|uniref:DNA repair protein XRCC2 n=1 Tax=Zootermopsis nevadensis TaxID=136037 RepID=A0A067QUC6_ZOONE|nr:ATPase SWSAP1-like [Zootermopsis nevadensis]KDR07748.1 hypothetical protein L798_02027 [Zootermopsis nevadensis]
MRPDNVHSVLLFGPREIQKSSFLFQCAVHFAEQGSKVLYISSTTLSALPPPVHGVSPPSTAALSHIRFMYLPSWQDLFKLLFSLHQHTCIPSIIIVDGLDHYCNLSDSNVHDKNHEQAMHAAHVCASLIDATSACARHTGNPAVLIASFHCGDIKINPLIDLFFSNIIWSVESDTDNGVVLTNGVILPQQSSRTQIVFRPRNWDGTLILHKILQLINNEKISENKVKIQA